jgi:RNA polymerase sigma factor (sigma-70 family)
MDDLATLVIQARNGDMGAFDALVRKLRGLTLRYAYTILHDWDLAQDVAQDAFVQAYLHMPAIREPTAFPVWLRTIVSRCCARVLRVKQLPTVSLGDADDAPSDLPSPFDSVAEGQLMDRIHRAIARLPSGEKTVTELFYMDGCSQKEIADSLGIPVTTVNNRLHSSRTHLRSAMADDSPAGSRTQRKPGMEALRMLHYDTTTRRLLKGDVSLTIRTMIEDDIPAMRALDDEIGAGLELANACRAPGNESGPGGPWSDTAELTRHFHKYQNAGNIILLAHAEGGKLIGFAELWAADEPEPFGRSLDVECIDFLWEYYGLGFEIVMLEEAEKVALSAGLPALDIGTNTSSGDYPSLRRFGMRLFYEYDRVRADCRPLKDEQAPPFRELPFERFDPTGLTRVSHWCPNDFDFDFHPDRPGVYEFEVDGQRVAADFWRLYDGSTDKPEECDLYAPPAALTSASFLTRILDVSAVLAARAGADEIPLPCPSDMQLENPQFRIIEREFAFAWMRKQLPSPG